MKKLLLFAILCLQFKNAFLIAPESEIKIEELIKKFEEQQKLFNFQLSSQPINNSYQNLAMLNFQVGLASSLNSETAKAHFKSRLTTTGEYSQSDKAAATIGMYNCFGAHTLKNGLEVDFFKKGHKNTHATKDLYSNLSIFLSRNPNCGYATLSALLNKTITIFGQPVFDKFLATPIIDVAELKKRQEIIKFLVDNPSELEKLENILTQIQDNELKLYDFFKTENNPNFIMNPEYGMYFETETFPYNFFKSSQKIFKRMNLTQWAMLLSLPIALHNLYSEIYPPLTSGFSRIKMFEEAASKEAGIHKKIYYGIKSMFEMGEEVKYKSVGKQIMPPSNKYPNGIICEFKEILPTPPPSFFSKLYSGISLGSKMGWIYYVFLRYPFHTLKNNWNKWINHYPKAFTLTYDKLCGISKIIDNMDEIESNLSKTPLKEIAHKIKTNNDNKFFKKLCSELDSSTFKNGGCFIDFKKGALLHHGKVLATAKQVQEDWTCMLKSLEQIGILDTYCTIARLFKDRANKKNKFCFVDYIEKTQTRPAIQLKNCWNPMARKDSKVSEDPRKVDLDTVVPFDINLGEMGDAHHLMLTGPNASGKSTFMRSILYSSILAQTFGIAPATQMRMTPFAFIDSFYDAAQDNSNTGDSSHKAQIKKLTNLIEIIDKFKGKPILFMADEICGTTNGEDASSTAIGIGQYIANKIPNSIFVLSSHHEKATMIERETRSEFRNYKITADVVGDNVNWTHKPVPGVNSVSTNAQLLKDAGMKLEIINMIKTVKSRL